MKKFTYAKNDRKCQYSCSGQGNKSNHHKKDSSYSENTHQNVFRLNKGDKISRDYGSDH